MKSLRYLSTMSLLALATVLAVAQDPGLGRGRGGGGGTGGGQSSPPSRPSSPPPSSPPPSGPSRTQGGGSSGPSRQDPGLGRGGGSNSGPSRQDPGLGRGGGSSSGGSGSSRDRDPGGSGSSRDRDPGGNTSRDRGAPSSGGSSRDRGGDPGLGAPRRGNDPGLGRGGGSLPTQSRTPYSSNSNVRTDRSPGNFSNAPVPPGIVRTDDLALRARRQDGGGFSRGGGFNNNGNPLFWNGWRAGYCHYNAGWNDSFFWFPNYCFNPWQPGINVNVVISPWYLYPFLPGYLDCSTVVVTNYRSPWLWNRGVVYVYDNRGWDNRWDWNGSRSNRNIDLDNSLEDMQDAFVRYDRRALSRLIPDRGQIAILRDGQYDYSMDANDFYDLINDLAGNAQQSRYTIDQVRTYRDSARIGAIHEYVDPWGRRQQVYHSFLLERERRGQMVIREFGTSDRRSW